MLPFLNEKTKFILMNIDQAPKRDYVGYYTVLLCYFILTDKDVFSNTVNWMFLTDHLTEFLEYSLFSHYVFDYKVADKCQTTHAVFVEKLYCTYKQADIGQQMKQCDGFINWFHQHCENTTKLPLFICFCRTCQKFSALNINSLPYLVREFFKGLSS